MPLRLGVDRVGGRAGPRDPDRLVASTAVAVRPEVGALGGVDVGVEERKIDAALAGRLDYVGFAEFCAENSPGARLAWLENWLTRSLKDAALGSDLVNNNRLPWLQPPGVETKIRAAYGLLDQLRDARRQVGGSLNTRLLFEGLAVSLAALLAGPEGKAGGSTG